MADATPDQNDAGITEDVTDEEGPWDVHDPVIAAHKYAAVMVEVSPSGIVESVQAQWFDTAAKIDAYFSEVSAELKDDVLNEYADFNVIVLTKIKTESLDKHLSYRVIAKPEQVELAQTIRKRLGSKRVGDLYIIGSDLSQTDEEFKDAVTMASKDAAKEKAKAEKLAEVKPKTVSKKKATAKGGDGDVNPDSVKPKVISKGKRRPGSVIEPVPQDTAKPVLRSGNKRRPRAS